MRRGYLRLGAFAGLLLIEILALTVRFDIKSLEEGLRGFAGGPAAGVPASEWAGARGHRIAWLFENASTAMAMAIAVASATLLLGGRSLRGGLDRAVESPRDRRSWPLLAGHFAALAAFVWLTSRVLEGGAIASAWAPAWTVAWLVSGAAVVTLLAAAALPPGLGKLLVRHGLRAILAGLLVGLAAAGAGRLTGLLWVPLGRSTLVAVRCLLGLVCTEPVYEPSRFILGTPSFSVHIAPQCSGYEGIGLVWAFLGAYLWFFRRELRFPRAWLLLPMGTAAIWLANVVRITALVMVGTWLSPEIAEGGFHSQAGWLGFNAVALGLVLLTRRSRFFRRDDDPRVEGVAGPSREAIYLAPLLMIVAAAMISGAFSAGGPDRYYPARLAAVAIPFWLYRRQYAAMRWTCSWQAVGIGVLVFTLWVARWPESAAASSTPSMMTLYGGIAGTAWLVARVIGSAVTVPLAEELAFRGFMIRRLIAADFDAVRQGRFTWTSFIISSVAFGMLHDRWLEGTMAGMLYALAYYRRGSLGDAVAAHSTTNALLCIDALLTGDWSHFS
jgi:exosortase E/protease (VPEID-CTERM system)